MAMPQKTRIKWRKLKRLAEATIKQTVAIHCSTEIPISIRAAADIYNQHTDIVLNLQHIKSEEEVIRAVAHELAHVLEHNTHHDEKFDATWITVYLQLRQDYFKK